MALPGGGRGDGPDLYGWGCKRGLCRRGDPAGAAAGGAGAGDAHGVVTRGGVAEPWGAVARAVCKGDRGGDSGGGAAWGE